MEDLKLLFKSPDEAIAKAKKKKGMKHAFVTLALGSIIVAIALAITIAQFGAAIPFAVAEAMAVTAVSTFLLIFLGGIFIGLLLMITVNTLGGKGVWADGITTIGYSLVAPSVGILAASVLSIIPIAGALIGFIVLAITFALGAATFYRSTKELFSVDMITAFVAISVLVGMLFISFTVGSVIVGANLGAAGLGLPTIPIGI